ncbi:hypothetical protein Hdeb2414_s0003g00101241 [Helianthus debilis subsp. tardiflorus]
MKNVWMGSFKLHINIARFSAENGEVWINRGIKNISTEPKSQEHKEQRVPEDRRFKTFVSSARSYVGTVAGEHLNQVKSKEVVVSEFVNAFDMFHNKATVGRVKDLWTLRKLNVLMNEAEFSGPNIKYLGGLNVLIVFKFAMEADLFRANAPGFGWFHNRELWKGQAIAFQRLAWLNIHGVPLHLSVNEVFDSIGRCFGKVIHASQLNSDDKNMTFDCVGVLTDSVRRIEEEVVIRKEGKRYRFWVEEEREDWVPDSVENGNLWPEEEDRWDFLSDNEKENEPQSEGAGEEYEEQGSGNLVVETEKMDVTTGNIMQNSCKVNGINIPAEKEGNGKDAAGDKNNYEVTDPEVNNGQKVFFFF